MEVQKPDFAPIKKFFQNPVTTEDEETAQLAWMSAKGCEDLVPVIRERADKVGISPLAVEYVRLLADTIDTIDILATALVLDYTDEVAGHQFFETYSDPRAVPGGPIFDALMDFGRIQQGAITEEEFIHKVDDFVMDAGWVSKEAVESDLFDALGSSVWLYLRVKAAETKAKNQTFRLSYEVV